jgi:hypothetical protein
MVVNPAPIVTVKEKTDELATARPLWLRCVAEPIRLWHSRRCLGPLGSDQDGHGDGL